MNKKVSFINELAAMPLEERKQYMHVATLSGRVCSSIGIGSILTALIFPNIAIFLLAIVVVTIIGHISCGIDDIKKHIIKLSTPEINS